MPVSSSTSRTAACSRGLAGLDVALRQRPEQPAAAVGAPDQGAARDVAVEVDDQAAGAELVHPAQPAARRRRAAACRFRAVRRLLRARSAWGRGPVGAGGLGRGCGDAGAPGHGPMVTGRSVRWPVR